MKNINIQSITFWVAIVLLTSGCFKDLNTIPIDQDTLTSELVFQDETSYRQFLAKIYAGLAVTGQSGPAGDGDIADIDEGFSSYLRSYWKAQTLTTDEAVIAWNDQTIKDYQQQDWDENDGFINAMYQRIFFQIALCNEFLRSTTVELMETRGVSESVRADVLTYRAEARFLRAMSYWHALDLFRNPPFVTEADGIGAFFPEQTNPDDLFAFIESELLEIEMALPEPRGNEYGRVDRAAAWMLLAKMYLNAEVHIKSNRYDEVIVYTDKVINAGYQINDTYEHLFLADNDISAAQQSIIFAIPFDGKQTQTWGGMTFLCHSGVGGSMVAADYGIDSGWGGVRTTSALVNKFPVDSSDVRGFFYKNGQSLEIASVNTFTDGYAVTKFKNITSTGEDGSDATHPDTDFPMFRLADAYLMYAEATLRGGAAGNTGTAVAYINEIRNRAYDDGSGVITEADLDLDFILDERARELYFECHRRTDLVRFGQFTSDAYLWPWKGNVAEGEPTDAFRNIFPIPAGDRVLNPNLVQNEGY